jgi:hypothetical protein
MPDLLDEEQDTDMQDAADNAGGDVPALPLPSAPAQPAAQPAGNPGALPPNWWIAPPKAPEIDRSRVNAIRDLYNAVPPGEAGKAIEMATRLEGILGFDADVKSGVPTTDALRKWAPKMYFNHPGAVSRLVQPPFTPGVTNVGDERLIQTSPNRYQLLPKPMPTDIGPLNARPIQTPEGKVLGYGLATKSGLHPRWNTEDKSQPKTSDMIHAYSAQLRGLEKDMEAANFAGDKAKEAEFQRQHQEALSGLYNITKGAVKGPPAAAKEQGPPKITSKAEYDALPHGAVYISKNGKPHRKP